MPHMYKGLQPFAHMGHFAYFGVGIICSRQSKVDTLANLHRKIHFFSTTTPPVFQIALAGITPRTQLSG